MILDKIDELLKEVQELSAKNAEEVEQLRLRYLSKKGEITALMNDFRNVAADQKKTVGMKINELKTLATERINQLREACEEQEGSDETIDLTRTPYPIQLGTRHPLTIVTNEIIDIFSRMGFVLADGPEVEDDNHVFTKMNFAADHPARDMQDTFFVSQHPNDVTKNILLRSHTSSVQARVMENMHTEDGKLTAPIRVICLSPSQSPLQRWISHASSVVAKVAVSANTQAGLRFLAAVWSTRTCWNSAVSTLRFTAVMPLAWALSASRT